MFDASTLEVFIASTNDLAEARRAVEEVLRDWNSRNGNPRQIMLKPIRWEEDVAPELGPGSFQAVINKQLLDTADILVGIFGKRLGSPTEKSISGTAEEIERFEAAKKPVLLYFSDEQFNLSEIDTQELERLREFRKALQKRGLYRTFRDIPEFKVRLRGDIDTVLRDFEALLIPAGRALAYGYFENFIARAHDALRGLTVVLPDYPSGKKDGMELSFASFRIRIAKPVSWDDATDDAVFSLKQRFLAEISVKTPAMRRAFRVYVPKPLHAQLERAAKGKRKSLQLECIDVIDFPTPMIALNNFVKYREKSILKGKEATTSGLGYWERQKKVQYNEFFDSLDVYIKEAGKQGPSIGYFDYSNNADFNLPA
jgi:hypothetical protein